MRDHILNCPNCGAPLGLSGSGRYLVCDHCGSSGLLPASADGDDCVISLGHPIEANCPACGAALVDGLMDECRVGYCPACRGVLLVDEDLAAIVRYRRANYCGGNSEPSPLEPIELQRHLDCPRCHTAMEVHPYYGPGNTVIDSCRTCGLIWLDHGEIARMERAPGRR